MRKVQAKLMTFVEASRGAGSDEDRGKQYMALANFNSIVSMVLESVDPEEVGRRDMRVAEAEVQTRMVQAQRDAAGEGAADQDDRGGAASRSPRSSATQRSRLWRRPRLTRRRRRRSPTRSSWPGGSAPSPSGARWRRTTRRACTARTSHSSCRGSV